MFVLRQINSKINSVFISMSFICLLLFTIGIALMLSSAMVFFRDTQFLWGIVSMIWMYLTPIIYPIDILPSIVQNLMILNPMYHYVEFVRTILIKGVSPCISSYILCLLSSVIVFGIGAIIFKKSQNKFMLYI